MKLFLSHLIFLLFASTMIKAQVVSSEEITYKVGAPYPVIDALSKQYFEHNGNIITVKVRKKDIVVQKLDATTLKFKSIRNYSDFPNDYVNEGIYKIQDRLFMFYSVWDKPNETEQLFYREIDFEKGTFSNSGKRLLKVKGKVTGNLAKAGLYKFAIVDKFKVNISADESKILIQYRKSPEKRNDDVNYDKIGFNVFDQNLEEIWSEIVKMPHTEKKMNNLDYAVDSYGNVFILTTVYKDDSTKRFTKDGKVNYHMELLKIDASTLELSQTKVELKDNFINHIWIYETAKGKITIAGFYSEAKKSYDTSGIFTAIVDKNGKLTNVESHKIPLEILNQYASKKTQAKNEKDADYDKLVLRRLVTASDGSILLVGEQHYIVTRTSTYQGRTTTRYTYYYNDMLLTKLNPDGSLAWMKKLPKRQKGTNGKGGMSFNYFEQNGSHYLMFLDNVKNIDIKLDEVPSLHMNGAGGYLTAYKVDDANGDVSKISILNVREVPKVAGGEVYQFSTNRILEISDKEFVVEFYKKKKEDVLIKFTIE